MVRAYAERLGLNLTKDSVVGISLGTLVSIILVTAYAVNHTNGVETRITDAFDKISVVADNANKNATAIHELERAVQIQAVRGEISDLEAEERTLKRELRQDPDNDLILDQIYSVEAKIEDLKEVLRCYRERPDAACQSGF